MSHSTLKILKILGIRKLCLSCDVGFNFISNMFVDGVRGLVTYIISKYSIY